MTIPICRGCGKRPADIEEYVDAVEGSDMTPDEYVRREEGTYNYETGGFLCTSCYIKAGMPASDHGWKAP